MTAFVLVTSQSAPVQQGCTAEREGAGDRLGYSLASIGDVDGDTVPDFVVGAPRIVMKKPGYVEAISGKDGHALYHLDGQAVADCFGISVCAVGDLDHDARTDFAVGAVNWRAGMRIRGAGYVRVFSGATGTLLRELRGGVSEEQFGLHVFGAPDLDGDQTPDILVSSPVLDRDDDSALASVRAYSGESGALLFEIKGKSREEVLGASVAFIDDANGDGRPDVLIGVPYRTALDYNGGYVGFYSGADGSQFAELHGSPEDSAFGSFVATGADLDNDGVSEILIGVKSPPYSQGWLENRILCYSGCDRSLLFAVKPGGGSFLRGEIACFAGDWNGNHITDIGITDNGSGRARVRSGANPNVILWEYSDSSFLSRFGQVLCFPGDLDGDARPDVVIGFQCWSVREGDPAKSFGVGKFAAFSGATNAELFSRVGGH